MSRYKESDYDVLKVGHLKAGPALDWVVASIQGKNPVVSPCRFNSGRHIIEMHDEGCKGLVPGNYSIDTRLSNEVLEKFYVSRFYKRWHRVWRASVVENQTEYVALGRTSWEAGLKAYIKAYGGPTFYERGYVILPKVLIQYADTDETAIVGASYKDEDHWIKQPPTGTD